MKKLLLFSLLLLCSFNAAFAQINKLADKATFNVPVKPFNRVYNLKVNVTVVSGITVKDHWQHTDLCTFKVIEALVDLGKMGEPSTGFGGCNMILTETKAFQVIGSNLTTQNADGSKTYSFEISGLKLKQEYGIDLIPSTEYLVPQPGYAMVVNYATNRTNCSNRSVIGGKTIDIFIGSGPIPR